MTTYAGGTRMRLISDSFYELVRSSLVARGWFDAGRNHSPIELVRGDVSWSDPIDPNTLAISDVDITDAEAELGSNFTEDTWVMYVDFYAESDSLGLDVTGDVRDILRGKLSVINRTRPVLPVFDYTVMPVPAEPIFFCDIEQVALDRSHNASRPQQYHWFSVRCNVVDEYYDDEV